MCTAKRWSGGSFRVIPGLTSFARFACRRREVGSQARPGGLGAERGTWRATQSLASFLHMLRVPGPLLFASRMRLGLPTGHDLPSIPGCEQA